MLNQQYLDNVQNLERIRCDCHYIEPSKDCNHIFGYEY